jgi:syntaxin 1B/2/3
MEARRRRRRGAGDIESDGVEMSAPPGAARAGPSLDRFFEDVDVTRTGPGTLTVESIKDELRDLERIQRSLHDANVGGKSLHDAAAVRGLRARMDADVGTTIKKAKVVKLRLESLDRANAANRSVPGCGHGSSTDRTRTSVVAGLRKKLRDSMESFSSLRSRSCTSTGTRWRGATSR